MPDRKSIVVDIVSDSKKFLSGFEESIKAIEKTAKKTDILGGIQDDIDELRGSINDIENSIKGLKPTVDNTALEQMASKISSLDSKIKTLKTNSKDIMYAVNLGREIRMIFTDLCAYYVGLINTCDDVIIWGLSPSTHTIT